MILKKKNKEGEINLPNIKVYHTATDCGISGGQNMQINGKEHRTRK